MTLPLILPTTLPNLLVASSDVNAVADNSAELLKHRVAHLVCVGSGPLPESLRSIPHSTVSVHLLQQQDEPGTTAEDIGMEVCSSLLQAAQVLQKALESVASTYCDHIKAGGLEEGDSTDDEKDKGLRLRVRIRRKQEGERWGINWHKDLFRRSHKLVVDDIVEDSIVARWNALCPSDFQLRYGDRLLRVNGVRADDRQAQKAAAKMRAELQTNSVRALFWRPAAGSAPRQPDAANSTVLLCSGGHPSVAAVVAAAHGLLAASKDPLRASLTEGEAALDSLSNAIALLRQPGAEASSAALCLLIPVSGDKERQVDVLRCASTEEKPEAVTNLEAAELEAPTIGTAQVMEAAEASSSDALATDRGSAQDQTALDADAAVPAVVEEGIHAPDEQSEHLPQWTFSCRRCSTALFHDLDVLSHHTDGLRKAERNWASSSDCCTSMFIQPMQWMGNLDGQTGRLVCRNPQCRQKLGGFSWHGLPCSCGQWQSPAFQIHCARLDRMPYGHRSRGQAPRPVF